MPRLFWILLLVLYSPVWTLAAYAQGGPPPAQVMLDDVRVEILTQRRAATGEIRSPMRSLLAVQIEGVVNELLVDEGDDVIAGQIIAHLDDTRKKLTLQREAANREHAEAVIIQRQAELDEAQRDFDRVQELERRGSAGVTEIDEAKTLLAARTALLAQAKAELLTAIADHDLAKKELADSVVRAPFSGQIVETHTEVGEWIARGGPVVTVLSLDKLEARVDIPQQYYAALRSTTGSIEVLIPAIDATLSAEMITIIPQADTLSRLFPARLLMHDPEGLLRPGMSVTAMIPTGVSQETTTVSKDAIVRTATGEHLFFDADGVAAMMPVSRLFGVGDRVAIRPGMLKAGMRTVVDGNERMMPGQPLIELTHPKSAIQNAADAAEGRE